MTEKQLQAKIVIDFSQTYPHHRGLLFEVNNDTYNVQHAITRKAIGMIAGVADLLLISPLTGVVNGIELKGENTRHKVDHIKQQLEWGDTIMKAGGNYIMSSSETEIKRFVESVLVGLQPKCTYPNDVDTTNKTVKF